MSTARLVVVAGVLAATLAIPSQPAQGAAAPQVRVDQVGYLPGEVKHAYLMTAGQVSSSRYSVIDASGKTVLTGSVGSASRGSWNSAYKDVYPITFSKLTAPGVYRLRVGGGAVAVSPAFRIESPEALYGRLAADGVKFFQAQRDGSEVIPGALGRKPAHLNDARAALYRVPHYETDSDVITDAGLTRIAGPAVDAEGGWFDAGDYLKFTHSTAYADALLFASQRALGAAAPAALRAEARHGVDWLDKMWDQRTKTLLIQVGIGSGNEAGTFTGDHDLWRLPETDDADTASADRFATAHRPVFRAAAPGAKVSPNLAGRISAAFALAAQVDAARHPRRAAAEYRAATSLYAMADTVSPPDPLTTALPHAFYPEDTWRDDMEFGASEIALAAQKLGRPSARYVSEAAVWARSYIAHDTGDTLNLYDTSALAHADLIQAIHAAGNPSGLAVTASGLVRDLKRQVRTGATRSAADIFRAGGVYTDFDADSHTFGFLTTEALYKRASGDSSYDTFATDQRNWLLGANAWGTSFMVGEGTTFPRCMQHQAANLKGSTDGTAPIATGAVVNGPNSTDQFSDGLGDYQDGMTKCPASGDPYGTYTGHGSRYVDDVRSWQSSEPALDMTVSAVAGAAFQLAARRS